MSLITAASYRGILRLNPHPKPTYTPFYIAQIQRWQDIAASYAERGNLCSARQAFEVAAAYTRLSMQAMRGQR